MELLSCLINMTPPRCIGVISPDELQGLTFTLHSLAIISLGPFCHIFEQQCSNLSIPIEIRQAGIL